MVEESNETWGHRLLIAAGKKVLRGVGEFQARHSRVGTGPVIDNREFAWVPQLEAAWKGIRAELDVLLEHPERIPAFHQISPDQKRISKGDNWKTFGLYIFGKRIDANCALCPGTARALEAIPGMRTAMFSILKPGYHIPLHKGPTRAVVRAHLGLKVPKERDKLWIRVGDAIIHWEEGKVVLFDDTYEHEVYNNTDENRAVLFIDIDRPMDRIGAVLNAALLRTVQMTSYVKKPLANVKAWNRTRAGA
ncbi:MAG: aspartyl/asparaginyl beta-hydroxylase domain-containing protein [Nevskiaceae bacterium]|nr:MAG: aspartyl/asparaginyl beta-hydroxylase domain-containing protein [Nevskiaceae bacterium]TBR74092.1 MAG: aspartyl/asparaginyl beta-hydroxylase domain-containing protein [Nevskiaceae bacterium]